MENLIKNRFIFGTWALGGKWTFRNMPYGWGDLSIKESLKLIEEAYRNGIRIFDTAPCYGLGKAEEIIGDFIRIYNIKDVQVITKAGKFLGPDGWYSLYKLERLLNSIDESLNRVGSQTSTILIKDPEISFIRNNHISPLIQTLNNYHPTLTFGCSSHIQDIASLLPIADGKFNTLMLEINMLNFTSVVPFLRIAKEKNYRVYAMQPLFYGLLSGKYNDISQFPKDDWRTIFSNAWLDSKLRLVKSIKEYFDQIIKSTDYSLANIGIASLLSCELIDKVVIGPKTVSQLNNSLYSINLINNPLIKKWLNEHKY